MINHDMNHDIVSHSIPFMTQPAIAAIIIGSVLLAIGLSLYFGERAFVFVSGFIMLVAGIAVFLGGMVLMAMAFRVP